MPKLFVKKGFGIFKIIPHPKFGKVIANNNTKPRRTKFFFYSGEVSFLNIAAFFLCKLAGGKNIWFRFISDN